MWDRGNTALPSSSQERDEALPERNQERRRPRQQAPQWQRAKGRRARRERRLPPSCNPRRASTRVGARGWDPQEETDLHRQGEEDRTLGKPLAPTSTPQSRSQSEQTRCTHWSAQGTTSASSEHLGQGHWHELRWAWRGRHPKDTSRYGRLTQRTIGCGRKTRSTTLGAGL